MEYIHFDNRKIDEFFKEATGKEKYTIDDVTECLEDKNVVRKEDGTFEYYLKKEEYELGIISEEPKIQTIDVCIGYEKRTSLKEIIIGIININLVADENSMSIQDFDTLAIIEKRLDMELTEKDRDDTIGIKYGWFHIFGSKHKTMVSKNYQMGHNVDGIDCDFNNTTAEDLKKEVEWLKKQGCDRIKKRFSSFRGITHDKLEVLGEDEYYIEYDVDNPYSKQEILQLLSIMENMKKIQKIENMILMCFFMYIDA